MIPGSLAARWVAFLGVAALILGAALIGDPWAAAALPRIVPVMETASVQDDADDPAIWVDPAEPSRSLLVGTNKVAAPGGALVVFNLRGEIVQTVAGLDRPNNVDVEYGLMTAAGPVDIAVTTERLQHRLRVFQIQPAGLAPLDNGQGIAVLDGEEGERREPMGIALYRRPRDGAVFAIVAPKNGDRTRYLWQYRLSVDAATGNVGGTLVRRFGNYSGTAEIEAVAVDDELGYVYYSDELFGIRQWHADPDHADAGREVTVFGRDGFTQQREGIAIVRTTSGRGFIVVSDQIDGATELRIYRREGAEHGLVAAVRTQADSTDGLEVVTSGLADSFPGGLLAMMNSRGRNFQLYRWQDVARLLPQ